MKKSFLKWFVVLVVVFLVLGLISYFIFKNRPFLNQTPLIRVQANIFSKLQGFRRISEEFKKWKNLSTENEKLKADNSILLSRLAEADNLKNENDFLRKSLQLSVIKNREVVLASIYSFSLGPNGYDIMINKGSGDGVKTGSIVITEEGNLVGKIRRVDIDSASIFFVADPSFQVNAKVLGLGTAGIAKGKLGGQMFLDLIVQKDEIKEGDMIISNGDDLFPGGLVIGQVSHVESNESQIFKKVSIRPSVDNGFLGKVLILSR